MAHLICKAYYDDEYRGEEFTPTHFVLEIDEPILQYLKECTESVRRFNQDNKNLLKIEFHFGFGLWTEFNELLCDTFEEEVIITKEIDEIFAIKIYNAQGQLIEERKNNLTPIQFNTTGIYFLEISNGKVRQFEKVIRQ